MIAKKKILCLHGGQQSGEIMKQKIAGSRKKLERNFELIFLDAPHECSREDESPTLVSSQQQQHQQQQRQFNWWPRGDDDNSKKKETFQYVLEKTKDEKYDAIIGFSQGGLVATAMVVRGGFPTVRAIVTAGAPYRQEPFDVEDIPGLLNITNNNNDANIDNNNNNNNNIPKLHFSGENDTMIPTESTKMLSDRGGNGRVVIHEKGHLFPTRAVYVNEMVEFLKSSLEIKD